MSSSNLVDISLLMRADAKRAPHAKVVSAMILGQRQKLLDHIDDIRSAIGYYQQVSRLTLQPVQNNGSQSA